MNDKQHNGHSNSLAERVQSQSSAVVETESQRAIQEVQAAMTIAQKFPRDVLRAKDRIVQACTRPTLAEGALYSYNKGGSEVSGPSIRLAEAMAQNWGNMQFGIRELEQRNGESTIEAFAWDLETNTRQVKVFTVPHKRHTRNGSYPLHDPREIYEHVANQGARRLRACILGIIPGDVVEEAVQQCEETMRSNADTSPEAIKRMAETFRATFNVSERQIVQRLGNRMESIRPAQMVQLRKIYASLRDGMSQPADWFEPEDNATSLKDMAKGDQPEQKPAHDPEASKAASQEEAEAAGTDGDEPQINF